MARKPTDKQLFKMKNEWLGQFYEEVKPKDFYRAVFPEGSFEREGHPEDEKCNGILTVIEGEKARNYIVFDELNMVDEVKGAEFAIMSPVGYSGRNRTAKNARWLYGIAIDPQYNFALFPPAMYPETMHAAFFRHIQPVDLQPVLQSTDHCFCRSEFFHF